MWRSCCRSVWMLIIITRVRHCQSVNVNTQSLSVPVSLVVALSPEMYRCTTSLLNSNWVLVCPALRYFLLSLSLCLLRCKCLDLRLGASLVTLGTVSWSLSGILILSRKIASLSPVSLSPSPSPIRWDYVSHFSCSPLLCSLLTLLFLPAVLWSVVRLGEPGRPSHNTWRLRSTINKPIL